MSTPSSLARLIVIALVALAAGLALGPGADRAAAGPLGGAPRFVGPHASFTWSMPDRFGKTKNGLVELATDPAFVNPSSWPVQLDACAANADSTRLSFGFWLWKDDGSSAYAGGVGACAPTVQLPSLGTWHLWLSVTDAAGLSADVQGDIEPRDFLIVSIGDSGPSGEGNPDRLAPNLSGGSFATAGFSHTWNDAQCHRSALSGPAQAALRLEQRDPHSSVTFVSAACSGARITRGLLNTYQGIEPTKPGLDCDANELGNTTVGNPNDPACLPPQVDRIKSIVNGRPLDALLVWIGMNDIQFSRVVTACLTVANCQTDKSSDLTLGVNGNGPAENGADFLEAKFKTLERKSQKVTLYDQLAAAIASPNVTFTPRGHVYLTEYPDPTQYLDRATNTLATCSDDELEGITQWSPLVQTELAKLVGTKGTISPAEFAWAKTAVVDRLNGDIELAAKDHGWSAIRPDAKFGEHGYCAKDTWFRSLKYSVLYQRNIDGAFHPNRAGHFYGYALPIEGALASPANLDVTAPALPSVLPADEQVAQGIDQGLAPLLGVLAQVDLQAELEKFVGSCFWQPNGCASITIQQAWQQAWAALQNKLKTSVLPEQAVALDAFLDDPDKNGNAADDGTYGPFKLDVEGTVTPHEPSSAYEVQLDVSLTGKAGSGFHLEQDALRIDDANGAANISAKAHLRLVVEPNVGVGPPHAYLDAKDAPTITVRSSVQDALPASAPLRASYGVLGVALRGPTGGKGIDIAGGVTLALQDTDNDGKFTAADWQSVKDAVDVSCDTTSHANIDLTAAAALAGISGDVATLQLADSNLCDGIAAPTLTVNTDLPKFSTLTIADAVNGLIQLVNALHAIQRNGDMPLPFLQDGLAQTVDLGDRITNFLVDAGLTDPQNPLTMLPLDPAKLGDTATLDGLIKALDAKLGQPGLDPTFDPATGRLLFKLKLQRAPGTLTKPLDFSRFDAAGLTGVQAKAQAQVTPTYSVNLGIAVDLTPDVTGSGRTILDRVLVQTNGAQISAGATVSANLDLTGRVGPLEVTASAQGGGGPVTLLAPRMATNPMLRLQLTGGSGGYASLTDLFDGDVVVTPVVNARVPHFDVDVKATVGYGATAFVLGSGKLGFEWGDVTASSGTDGPHLTTDASYDDTLMRFDFAHADPQKLIGLVLTALRDGVDQLDQTARQNETLARSLPMIGSHYDEMVSTFGKVRDFANQLIALNQSLSLQGLEQVIRTQLQTAFGLTEQQAADLFRLEYDGSGARPAVVVRLKFCQASTDSAQCHGTARPLSVPFNLDTGNDNGVVGASGTGKVSLDYLARGELDFGVELPKVVAGDSTSPLPHLALGEQAPSAFVLGSSGATVAVRGELNAIAAAHLASFDVSLGRPADAATAKISARYTVDSGGAATERLAPAAWAAKVVNHIGDGTFSIHPLQSDAVDCGIAAKPGPWDGCAKLPVYIQAQGSTWTKLGEITFTSSNLLAGGNVDGAQTIMSNLTAYALRFSTLIDGLRAIVNGAKQSLDGSSIGERIPLLGEKFAAGSQVLGQLDQFLAKAQGIVSTAESAVSATALEAELPKYIAQALGKNGLDVLLDANGDNVVDANDVTVTVACQSVCSTPLTFKDVRIEFAIGRQGVASTPPFQFGPQGFNLSSGDRLTASAGWKLHLAFGVDRARGFYVDTQGQELTVSAAVGLPATLHGELAFLPVTITDNHAGDDLNATFGVDLKAGDPVTHHLYLTDLLANGLNLSDRNTVGLTIKGCADIDLGVRVGSPALGGQQPDDGLPGLLVEHLILGADWGGCASSTNTAPRDVRDGLVPVAKIQLKGVKLDLGTTFSNVIRPAVQSIQKATKPLQPIIDEVDKPVPVVNDLSVLIGNGNVSWFDAWAKSQQLQGNDVTFIRTVKNLVTFVDSIPAVGSATVTIADDVTVNVGQAVKPPTTPEEAAKLIDGIPQVKDVVDQIAQQTGFNVTLKANAVAGGAGAKFTFPAFQNPASLLQMLFGKDVDLVVFDAGPLRAKAEFNLAYGFPFAKVGIAGSASVSGHLALSYDTKGIRELFKSKPITLRSVAALVHGIGLNDLDASGQDVRELQLDADAHVYANVGIPLVSVEARGGVEGSAWLDLHDDDGDGKIRYEDVRARITQPQCLFDSGGYVQAYARIVVTGGPLSGTKDIVQPKRLMEVPDVHQWCKTAAPEPAGGELSLDVNSLQFGDVGVGTTSTPQAVVVSNRGKGPLPIAAVSAPSGFAAAGTCGGATLAPGQSCTVAVTAQPASGGAKSGNLDIWTGGSSTPVALSANGLAPQLSVTPASYDFGAQVVRTVSPSKTIVLRNAGGGVLAVKSIVDANTNDAFVLLNKAASKCPVTDASLTAGAACTIEVYFAPTVSGTQTGKVTVTLAGGSSQDIVLSGKGAAPAISFSPGAGLTFGPQAVRTTSPPQVVTITNTGDAVLKIASVDGGAEFPAARRSTCPASIAPNGTCEIEVRFKPAAGGSRTGSLALASNTVAQTDTLPLAGEGRAVPVVVIDKSSLAFGSQPLGTTGASLTVKVTNDGTASLVFSSLAFGGTNAGEFTIIGGTCTNALQSAMPVVPVTPEQSCTVKVAFSPTGTATGARTAELQLADAALDSPQRVQLAGTAIAAGAVYASPTAIVYDDQRVGTTSTATTVTMTNNSPTALTGVHDVLTGSGKEHFRIVSDTCRDATLAANGGSCVLAVASAPHARGDTAATIVFTAAPGVSLPSVDLSGHGIAPVVEIEPAAGIEFDPYRVGNVTDKAEAKVVTIRNTGDDVLNLTSVGASGDFLTVSYCGTFLPPKGSCTVSIRSAPQGLGDRGGALTFVDDLGTQTVPLLGRGAMPVSTLSPSGVSFGLVPVGSAGEASRVVIANDGDWPLRVSGISVSGANAADFSITGSCDVVRPDESCAIDVAFAPGAAGVRAADLVVTSDATTAAALLEQRIPLRGEGAVPLPSLSTSALAFGGVEVGSTGVVQTVGLKNLGNAPLRVGNGSVSGDAGRFPVSSDTCSGATLEPGDGCSVGFAFAPVAVGATSATLSLPTNAGAVTVQLGGTGTAAVALFGSSVLDFGGAVIGTETRLEVDLRNDGTAPLLLERLGVDGEAASDFAADASACGRALAPGETCRITVVFSPLELGDRKAALELPGGGGAPVALVGYGGERPKSRDAGPAPDETPPPAPAPESA